MKHLSDQFLRVLVICALAPLSIAATADDTISRATGLARAGKVKEAETLLRSAVTEHPDSAPLHGALGKLLFEENNYTESVQELNQAEQLDPDSRQYNMLLAAVLLAARRDGVAKNFLLAIEPRFKQYPEFHYSLGLAYYYLTQIAKSEAELETSLKIDPTMDRAKFLLSACYASEGEFAKAATTLRQLTAAHPRNVIYWSSLADVLRQKDPADRAEALRACRRALAIQRGDPHTQFVMATIFLESGDYKDARGLLEHLESISPKELEAHVALARVYSRLGEPELARKETQIVNQLRADEDSENPQGMQKPHQAEQR
jgi:predicted Zn-dependent protease